MNSRTQGFEGKRCNETKQRPRQRLIRFVRTCLFDRHPSASPMNPGTLRLGHLLTHSLVHFRWG